MLSDTVLNKWCKPIRIYNPGYTASIVITMAPIALPCPAPACEYSTTELEPAIAIQMLEIHRATNHVATPAAGGNKAEKPRRPLLELPGESVDETGWALFLHEWQRYKVLGNLTENLSAHLQDCLSPEINRILYSTHGPLLTTQNEATVLNNIKSLVVRARNPLVSVVELMRLHQGSDQPVQTFLAQVKSTARHCMFKVKCTCELNVDYTDQMVLHQLLVGLYDNEVQEDLLAIDNITLDKAIKLVTDREAAKRSQGTINSDSMAAVSTYKKNKKAAFTPR